MDCGFEWLVRLLSLSKKRHAQARLRNRKETSVKMPEGRNTRVRARISSALMATVCSVTIACTAMAQMPATPPMPKDAGGGVKFNVPKIPTKVGAPYAFNLCTGTEVPLPRGMFTSAMGQALDTKQGQCGDQTGPKPGSTVGGGNPPYHFQLDTMGGFPPIGMHLGLNGLLYGTPIAKPPLGGFPAFNVCAVDLNGSQDCHPASFGPAPAAAPQQAAKAGGGHAGTIVVLGLIVGVGVAGAAYEVEKNKTSSSSSQTGGQCSGISSVNACGACTSDSQCGSGGACFLYASDGGQKAPFCN
jgi:hypothetical protein